MPDHRGTGLQTPNRFESTTPGNEAEPREAWEEEEPSPSTRFLADASVSIITRNNSPDVGFSAGVNPYRGCEHGCAYCYARPTHEYLGYSAGLDFETKILVKHRAPELLAAALSSPKWVPEPIGMSGVTDCYQPVEGRLKLTQGCLEVLARFLNPVFIITKNQLVARDADLLSQLAKHQAVSVCVSVTTLDPELRSALEPRTSPPAGRLAAIRALSQAGIPVGVFVAPVIPGLNDHEIPRILEAAAAAGAGFASYTLLRLPLAVEPIFLEWLERNQPLRKERIIAGIREVREGELHDPRFGSRMRGSGPAAERIRQLFSISRRRHGLASGPPELSVSSFRVPDEYRQTKRNSGGQLELF